MRKLVGIVASLVIAVGVANAATVKTHKPSSTPSNNIWSTLYQPAGNTIMGNPKAPVTVVEFFDYNCGYCRMIYPQLQQLTATNPNVRIIFREYPVLSSMSMLSAQAAIAATKQGKYQAMHDAMISAREPLEQDEIMRLADQVGLNTTQLAQDMQAPEVTQQIQANLTLGNLLNLKGVPAFLVARTNPPQTQQPILAVGPSISQLQGLIQEAKNGA